MSETGYYGIPGKTGGRVHVVRNGRPMCGERLHPEAVFQWCAHGIWWPYVECIRCRDRARRGAIRYAESM